MRLLLRRDPFRRFYSCLVFVPREKYNTQVRQRIERVIGDAFVGDQHGIAGADRRIEPRAHPHRCAHRSRARRRASTAMRSSGASLSPCVPGPTTSRRRCWRASTRPTRCTCSTTYAPGLPRRLHRGLRGRRRRRSTSPFLEAAEKEPQRLHLDIYRPEPRRKDKFFLKIFRVQQDAIPISDLLPMLENMGLKVIAERPYRTRVRAAAAAPGFRTSSWSCRATCSRSSTRWPPRSRARSPPSGPAAWTATASIS